MLTLVGLSGYARSGKSTVASILAEQHGFQIVAFADALKQVALNSNPYVRLNSGDMVRLRDLVQALGWDDAKRHEDVRGFLQRMGTEGVRGVLGQDTWVNAWRLGALAILDAGGKVVAPDCRFPNEAEVVQALGGAVWRIDRELSPPNLHPSETSLDLWSFNLTIYNTATLSVLAETVKKALESYE